MSIIKAWGAGSAYQNLTPEARVMLSKWQMWCDGCVTGEYDFSCKGDENANCRIGRRRLLNDILDITDTRTVCVVFDKKTATVRQFVMVSDDAEEHIDELKAEFYAAYTKCPDDEFRFFKGLHRALEYAESEVWLQNKEETKK